MNTIQATDDAFEQWLHQRPNGTIAQARSSERCPIAKFVQSFNPATQGFVGITGWRVRYEDQERWQAGALTPRLSRFRRLVDDHPTKPITKRVALTLWEQAK